MQNSVEIFECQFSDVQKYYPELRIYSDRGNCYLQGTIDIQADDGEVISSYFIRITHHDGFPYRFPNLYEIGGDIPSDADWHKYIDNSCCVTAPLIEKLACIRGITILEFIKNFVVPYLANQYHRKRFGYYKDEYSHGSNGLLQSYADVLKSDKVELCIEYLNYAITHTAPNIRRNAQCNCGSGKKYKNCHRLVLEELKKLNVKDLLNIINHISLCMQKRECL